MSLTQVEVKNYLKDIYVTWDGPRSDIIFKVLVESSKLNILGILISFGINTYMKSDHQRNILDCQGLDTILNIQECRKVYFVIGLGRRWSLTDGTNSAHIKTMERLLTELCSKPRRPAIQRTITISAHGKEQLAEESSRGVRRKSYAY
jgi:hypothetical protein